MDSRTKKPRLVFFQWQHKNLPKFLLMHTQMHVKCLSEYFDVTVINKDCDYQQVCEACQPDLALFESGYKTSFSRKIKIKNISANTQIPKLGLHNGDPWCDCRPGFISDMEHWGIETFFSISVTTAEHTPEIAENLFVWPNFIDSDICRDYGESKNVPILFTGSMIPLYPWRQKIFNVVANRYPSLIFPHYGYDSDSQFMIYGEQYARTINASWLVPACGTVVKEVVRKHFEVPGSKSCLITEKSPSLEAAGFVDMQNCVFADEKDVLDKLDYLFKNRNELEKIINAGYEFIHSSHTLKQRDQIYQWYSLNKNLKTHERIVQPNPFKPMLIAEKSACAKEPSIRCNGLHLEFLNEGDKKLWAEKYDEAETSYLKCLNYISSMAEPKLKLAICNLRQGNVERALHWIIQPIQYNLGIYGALDSDPVEWAYYIITLLCQGKMKEAIIRASQFPLLSHTELFRTRWVVHLLQNKGHYLPPPSNKLVNSRYSIHQLPKLSFNEWIDHICNMFKACGQENYINILRDWASLNEKSTKELKPNCINFMGLQKMRYTAFQIKSIEKLNSVFEDLHIPVGKRGLPSIFIFDYIFRICKWLKINSIERFIIKSKSYFKHFLKNGRDEFNLAVQNILQNEGINSVIQIGSSNAAAGTKSVFLKQLIKCGRLNVFHINVGYTQASRLKHIYIEHPEMKYYGFFFQSHGSFATELNNYILKIKLENKLRRFDLVLIDGSNNKFTEALDILQEARYIILTNINTHSIYKHTQWLLLQRRYFMIAQNVKYHNGYTIFKNIDCQMVNCLPGIELEKQEVPH